jgi:hypothetical protein
MKTYGRSECRRCGKRVSVAGFAQWNHWRKHYREVFGTDATPYRHNALSLEDAVMRAVKRQEA